MGKKFYEPRFDCKITFKLLPQRTKAWAYFVTNVCLIECLMEKKRVCKIPKTVFIFVGPFI